MKKYLLACTLVLFTATISVFGYSPELNIAGDCPNEIFILPTENCNSFIFSLPESAFGNILWDFSDAGTEANETSIEHTFPGPGIYTVCANLMSMDCPGICIQVEVLDCTQNCGLQVEVIEQGSCGLYVMEAYDFPEGSQIIWTLNGETYNVGHVTTFDLPDGANNICAFYESVECPFGVEWCEEFLVNCGLECQQNEVSFGIDSWTNQDGPAYVNWSISTVGGTVLESGFSQFNNENPFYDGELCLEDGCYQLIVQSPEPFNPQGLELEVVYDGEVIEPVGGLNNFENYSIQYYFGVNNDCFEVNLLCNAEFTLQNTPNGVIALPLVVSEDMFYAWSVDGQYYSDNQLEIFTLGPGEYEICLHVESGFCLEEACQIIVVTNEDCPNEILSFQSENCNSFAFQLPESAFGNVFWDFSDGGGETTGTSIDHTFPGPGTYTVCANPLSMDCPGFCTEVVVQECNQNCTLSAEVISDVPCGLYILEAFDFPDGAQINWQLDGEFYNTGYVTTFELSDGNHTICAFYETPDCPNGAEWCEEFNINCNPGCEENTVNFGVDSWTNQGGPSSVTWSIATVGGSVIESGVAQYNGENPFFDGSICLPDGCYQLAVQSPEPINPEGLNISVGMGGNNLPPVGGILNSSDIYFQYFFGVNSDCSEINPPCDASFSIQNTPNGVVAIPAVYSEQLYYAWMVDGQYYSDNPLETFTLNPGEHEICLYIESGFCLEESCQTINVTNDECSTVFLTVNTIGPEVTGLDGQTFTITNSNNEVVGVYTADYNAAEAWSWNTCLPSGCYSVAVQGDCCMEYGPNLDTYYMIEMSGQNVVMSPFFQFGPESGAFQFSVNSDCIEPWDCEEGFYAGNPSCNMGEFEVGSFVEGGVYLWTFGDGAVSDNGHFVTHEYAESGVYEVCVTYTVPGCEYSITQCEMVAIECGSDCPSEIFVGEGNDCGTIVFEASNFVEGEEVTWIFGDGTEEFGGHFIEHHYENAGVYTVLVEYSSNLCPGVLLTAVVIVEECGGSDCPTELYASETGNCGSWVFETSNFAEGEQVIWSFGDGDTEIGGHFADHHYDEPGVYTVTAQYTSNACPNVTTLYAIIEVSDCETDCEEISFSFDSYVNAFGPEQIEYHLYDAFGELYLSGNASYNGDDYFHDDVACLPDGCYEMVIECGVNLENAEFNSSPFIDGSTLPVFDVYYGETGMSYEFSINSDCNPECTEFSITLFSNPLLNGPTSGVFSIFDENENMLAFEEFYTDGPSSQTFSFCLPDGCYSILNDGGCCVVYGQNFAYTGSDNVIFGSYTPNDAVSGSTPFSLNGSCEWDSSCEPVQLTVSGNFVGEAVVQWILESDEYELTGLLPLDALLNGEFAIDWCLPQECFSVTFQSDGPLPMEALLLELYAQQLQEELGAFEMQFGEDFIQFDFGYSEACVVAVDETDKSSFVIYPNPSNGIFTIELAELLQTQIVQVYDLAGRLVHSTRLNQTTTQLDLSALSAGLYQLTLIGEDSNSSAKIQILR